MKKHPLAYWSSVICLSLCMSLFSSAQDGAKDAPKAEAGEDLYKKVLGYWVLDLDSAEIKAIIAGMSNGKDQVPPEYLRELDDSTYEFKPSEMLFYAQTPKGLEKCHVKVTIKSQDLEKQIVHGDFEIEGEKSMSGTIQINGDRLVLSVIKPGFTESLGMKRIDEETFKKRVTEPKQEEEEAEEEVKEPQAAVMKDGYPVGTAVPDKPGFVFSPYNNRIVDVREIPSGTLVMDPHYPGEEKKFFWVP